MPNGTKPGAEPSQAALAYAQEAERRGGWPRDSVLIARCLDVAIWQTEKYAPDDEPLWCPPFDHVVGNVLYRGFSIAQLPAVLDTGLDVAPQSPFFATTSSRYGWRYPSTRDIAAMMVIEGSRAQRSFVYANSSAPDKATYPHEYEYVVDGIRVHSRFDHMDGRGPHAFSDESFYGYWIPGDAHAALVAVVLGGPHAHVLRILEACAPTGLELVR